MTIVFLVNVTTYQLFVCFVQVEQAKANPDAIAKIYNKYSNSIVPLFQKLVTKVRTMCAEFAHLHVLAHRSHKFSPTAALFLLIKY